MSTGWGHHLQIQQSQQIQQIQQPPQSIDQIPDRFRNQGRNTVSSMVGGYKSAVTRQAHRSGFDCVWQSRFHDHVIRNDEEYQRINEYIETNPVRWGDDRYFTPETSLTGNNEP